MSNVRMCQRITYIHLYFLNSSFIIREQELKQPIVNSFLGKYMDERETELAFSNFLKLSVVKRTFLSFKMTLFGTEADNLHFPFFGYWYSIFFFRHTTAESLHHWLQYSLILDSSSFCIFKIYSLPTAIRLLQICRPRRENMPNRPNLTQSPQFLALLRNNEGWRQHSSLSLSLNSLHIQLRLRETPEPYRLAMESISKVTFLWKTLMRI